ncbi:AraC family transcriptional regulator [Paenibacillus sp. sptzw28]|uniref:AraC family transcriptional regulator n=1 Tax=Paenibacillus sp. sptzw28 TaxID=715179 RepID=UPI001C6E9049|nr:helix-turn-helix domain-containing protein [Paenibacillus sp. sptzw28]QYR22334.1 AraC family transcriptional regulator [Paenibacillus sp. sptzw28]
MSNQPVTVQERHRLLVFNVMDYIEEHLNEKLTLHKVAELVSYSPFHFHRLFKAVTSENLNDYVKRTRLERALTKIILFHDQSLSEIAIDCGFSSIGDFSRSFKSYFGRNASEFREQGNRQNRKICEIDRKITERYFDTKYYNSINPDGTTRIEAKRSLKVTVKQLPSYSVIYDRCIGRPDPFSDQERIRQAFERVSTWAKLKPNVIYQSMNIGIPYYFPLLGEQVHWRYDACRTIPANLDGDLGMGSRRIAGGTYGVIQLEKHPNLYDSIMDILFYEWLPESGFVFDDSRPLLELFPVSDVGHAVYVDCCIPIIKRG